MSDLLKKLLLQFIRPGVDGEEQNLDLDFDDAAEQEDQHQDNLEASSEGAEDEEAVRLAAEQEAQRAAAEKARKDAERLDRLEREQEEIRRANAAKIQSDDELTRQEDAILNDPNRTEQEKWTVKANREIRAARQAAQRSEMNSQDVLDKSSFVLKCQENPRLLRVRDDVERELASMRTKGQNAPREVIAYLLLGKMVASAPVKKPAKKAGGEQINRGKLPGARSDVHGKTGMTEHQKRTKRLEGVVI